MPSPTPELLRLLAVVNSRLSEDVSLPILAVWAHRSRFDLHRRFRRLAILMAWLAARAYRFHQRSL